MFKVVLDSGELAFPIRQLDEDIQVMEFMIRKAPALDNKRTRIGEESVRTKLSVGKQAEHRQKSVTKSLARRRNACIDDGVPRLTQAPQYGHSWASQQVLAPANLWSTPSACATSRNIQHSFAECGAMSLRSRRLRDPNTRGDGSIASVEGLLPD